MSDTDFLRKSLVMLSGLLAWAAHFAFVYGFNTLACARQFSGLKRWGVDVVTLGIAGATVIAVAVVLAFAVLAAWRRGPAAFSRERTPANDFLRAMTVGIALLALVAILWTALPVFVVDACG